MTYHSRGNRGPAPIRPWPLAAQWAIFVVSAAGAWWFFHQAAQPGNSPEIRFGAWALVCFAVTSFIGGVGMILVDGMRRLSLIAPPLTIIIAALIASAFTNWALSIAVIGVAWLVVALIREGTTPYYLR